MLGLDAEWVAAQVGAAGAEFVEFVGTGQMSRNARFALQWDTGDTGGTGDIGDGEDSDAGPASVVVKVPSAEAATRAASAERGLYLKECAFYRSIVPLVDVVAPAALAVHFDEATHDFAIVLEDLAGSEQGDQFSEPSMEQLRLAVAEAAALHAPVWGKVEAPVFDPYRSKAGERARFGEALPMFLPVVIERLGAGLEAGIPELLDEFSLLAGRWLDRDQRDEPATPGTLVHGDFRPDNFMFGVADAAPPIAVVDWQTLFVGQGVVDIAYLLGGSVGAERRRSTEAEVLARYVDELAARGVEYPLDRCHADYALASLHGVMIALGATVLADQTERGDALFTLMLNRHGRHALDLDAIARVAALPSGESA